MDMTSIISWLTLFVSILSAIIGILKLFPSGS